MKPYWLPGLCLIVLLSACRRDGTPDDGSLSQASIPGGEAAPPAWSGVDATAKPLPAAAGEFAFVEGVDRAWFPLRPGTAWTYAGDDDGVPRREEARVLAVTRDIAGVACIGLAQEVYLDGKLVEFTTEWFAQDEAGNVWKFGEETLDLEQGRIVPNEDSWTADDPETPAWRFLPAEPQAGDVLAGASAAGPETVVVLSVDERVSVPAGTFDGCLQVQENPDDPEDSDLILYGRGVGMLSEIHADGRLDLVEMRDP